MDQGSSFQLQGFISSLSSSTSNLIFVTVCVVFSMFLLNTGGAPKFQPITKRVPDVVNRKTPPRQSFAKDQPEPKWHVLKIMNFAAVISFVTSLLYFASDLPTYLNDSSTLLKFMAGWSIFLCYFIGFFGISFVDADELARSEEEPCSNISEGTSICKNKVLHPPIACAPLCSDHLDLSKSHKQKDLDVPLSNLSNHEIANMVFSGHVKDHELEKTLDDHHRAVEVRRIVFESKLSSLGRSDALRQLPHLHSLDYRKVFGSNCEVVVGFVPIPVGMVGPITLNNETVYFPMATTEGCLVASTNRGCKAISLGSGAFSSVIRDGITRAPCLRLPSAMEAAALKLWCDQKHNFALMKVAFESTTSFGKLLSAEATVAGRNVYLRLCCSSGDAMGMNMVSKGSLALCEFLKQQFPTITLVALSGNLCTDKKAAAINWIQGRGKSVVVEATIPKAVVQTILKTNVKSLVEVNTNKNLIGSAMAGTVGGFNAHAANIVTAIFLATGQDPAQNVESSNCITIMEQTDDGDLWISCTMPSIEVGTVGGGTSLPAQEACLKVIGCDGGNKSVPGDNAKRLAHVIAAATMAGELSLLAALSANTLVQAHMQHNRKAVSKD